MWQADPNFNNEQHLTNPHDGDAFPDYVDALVARATARDREQRPADAGVLLHHLRRVNQAVSSGVRSDRELVEDLLPRKHADTAEVRRGVEHVASVLGPIDVLVNVAGWDRFLPFVDTTPDFWERVIAINYRGPLNTTHAVLPSMIEHGRGRISVELVRDGGSIVMSVGDEGQGPPPGPRGGLGLTIAAALVREELRGRIDLRGKAVVRFPAVS